MIASEINPTKIVEINIHDRIESSFPVLDVFVQVACFIARGGNLTVIGKEIKSYKKLIEIQPKVNQAQNQIIGGVIYIDNLGISSQTSKKKCSMRLEKVENSPSKRLGIPSKKYLVNTTKLKELIQKNLVLTEVDWRYLILQAI